jgi:dTDP-4-dehydrorhamnose reductase
LNVIVTGAGGLVGRAMVSHAAAQGENVYGYDHAALDIADESAVRNVFESTRPEVVINCAAWTDVDGCEFDHERAMAANAQGPEVLALACRKADALLITISTDYVFDGTMNDFYTQDDQPNPINFYGVSKLEGERRSRAAWARTIVVRSGYIFGPGGKNFLSTFIVQARRGEPLMALTDMVGTPTYGVDLAARIYDLARLNRPDIYHVVNAGEGASFADFARAAVKLDGLSEDLVRPATVESLNRPAPRPRSSKLRCLLSDKLGLSPLPSWQDALSRFLAVE